jgi:hypothetical protein
VSQAFVKETDTPKVVLGFYCAYRARGRYDFDLEVEFDSDNLLKVMRFVLSQPSGWQIRDTDGVLLGMV